MSQPFSTPQQFGKPEQPTGTSGMAISSLILGIASFVCSVFTGLPAIILGIMGLGKISASQGRIGGKGMAIAGIVLGSLGSIASIVLILIGMLLPAVSQVRTAARRVQSMNTARQLALAALNYESANQQFPSNFPPQQPEAGENLSWRVHILPYLEEDLLYSQFHLDEPWDSPHNIALIPQMPAVFEHLELSLPPGHTVYQMVASAPSSPDPTILVQGKKGPQLGQISDGTSNTVLIVEVNEEASVPWTQPQDWNFSAADPKRDLGGNWAGNATIVAMCDGSTHFINIDEHSAENIKAMMTRESGDGPPLVH